MDFDENLQIKIDEKKVDEKVKMILVTHLFGIPQNINKIISIAEKNNLKIIEDCSHAHGAILKGKYLGTFGDIGIFSLQGDKAVSGGEGGIAISNKKNLYEKMKLYGHMGRDLSDVNFLDEIKSTGIGKKCRMHPLAAGLAIIELKYLRKFNLNINKNIFKLRNFLKNYSNINSIDNLKFSKMGGFYYGYPIWLIKGEKDYLLSNWPNIFKDYPYPLYHKKKYFTSSEFFLKTIKGENILNNKTNLNLFNTEKAYEKLIFIDYNFLIKYNLGKEKLLRHILAKFNDSY